MCGGRIVRRGELELYAGSRHITKEIRVNFGRDIRQQFLAP